MHDKICYYRALGFKGSQLAAIVGVSPSTLAEWLATGEDAREMRAAGGKLTALQNACRELVDGIERAIADRLIAPQEMLTAEAKAHRKTKFTHIQKQVVTDHALLRNANGDPEWVEEFRTEITEEPSVGAATTLYIQQLHQAWAAEPRNNRPTKHRSNSPTSNGVLPRRSRK